jgi:endonuclease/exonuclease/phosphatase family metal-dependent hydrolase
MEELTVLSLNLRFGLADDGPHGWEHRKEVVAKLFKRERPHFIAAQEVNHFQCDYLVDSLPDYRHIGRRRPAPEFWQDNILFYRKPILCEREVHFFLSHTPFVPSRSFGSKFPRQATLGLFEVEGRPFLCVNTHLDFDEPAQIGAARVIAQQVSSFPSGIPLVLIGDFNATPKSRCYRWFTGKEEESRLKLKETFNEPYPSTFHGFTGKPTQGYIDWILYREPLQLKDCEVLQEALDGTHASDHFPVKAVFGFV